MSVESFYVHVKNKINKNKKEEKIKASKAINAQSSLRSLCLYTSFQRNRQQKECCCFRLQCFIFLSFNLHFTLWWSNNYVTLVNSMHILILLGNACNLLVFRLVDYSTYSSDLIFFFKWNRCLQRSWSYIVSFGWFENEQTKWNWMHFIGFKRIIQIYSLLFCECWNEGQDTVGLKQNGCFWKQIFE